MAQVTVELGRLLDRTDFELFDFDYTFNDQAFKAELEQAVIDFYYDYEIGQETPDMFKRKFKARWNRIITYYNDLYNTTLLTYNPLTNYSMDEALDQLSTINNTQDTTSNTTNSGTTGVTGSDTSDQTITADSTRTDDLTNTSDSTRTDNTTQDTDSNEMVSDYPQQPIAGGDYLNGERDTTSSTKNTGTVENTDTNTQTGTVTDSGSSTTNIDNTNTSTTNQDDTSDTTANVTNNGTNDMNYTKTIEGITGITYQELIQRERANILRIAGSVINEMKPCFILVY